MHEILGYPVEVVPDERTAGCDALSEVRHGRRRILVSDRLAPAAARRAAFQAAAHLATPANDVAEAKSKLRLRIP